MDTTAEAFSFEQLGVTPWSVMILSLVPLALIILFSRTYPTRLMAAVFAIPVTATLILPLMPEWWWILVACIDLVVIILALIDLLSIPKLTSLEVERSMARVASLGGWHPVELAMIYRGERPLKLRVTDDASEGLVIDPAFHKCTLQPRTRTVLHHRYMPGKRGEFRLEFVYLALLSRWELWSRIRTLMFQVCCMSIPTSSKSANMPCWHAPADSALLVFVRRDGQVRRTTLNACGLSSRRQL